MKALSKYFLRGTLFFLPFGLTIYILLMLIIWSETITSSGLRLVLPDFYVPGLGLVLAVLFLIVVGMLISRPTFGRFLFLIELPFKNVPLIKSIYFAVRSLADYFSPDADHSSQQVVMVKMPGIEAEVAGFVTRTDYSDLPPQFNKEMIAVYIPLSYQIGGTTLFVPKSWIRPIDMKVEVAMRSVLTGWMPARQFKAE